MVLVLLYRPSGIVSVYAVLGGLPKWLFQYRRANDGSRRRLLLGMAWLSSRMPHAGIRRGGSAPRRRSALLDSIQFFSDGTVANAGLDAFLVIVVAPARHIHGSVGRRRFC